MTQTAARFRLHSSAILDIGGRQDVYNKYITLLQYPVSLLSTGMSVLYPKYAKLVIPDSIQCITSIRSMLVLAEHC